MTHPLVTQLRFTRSELRRALRDISETDARIRLEPMNCVSWMVGHLAWHEHWYWVRYAQGQNIVPHLSELVGTGQPGSAPPLDEMWSDWRQVTDASNEFLDTLTRDTLLERFEYNGKPAKDTIGTMMNRLIYHYWFHIGEAMAIRQLLGATELPEFVGDISGKAPYRHDLPY